MIKWLGVFMMFVINTEWSVYGSLVYCFFDLWLTYKTEMNVIYNVLRSLRWSSQLHVVYLSDSLLFLITNLFLLRPNRDAVYCDQPVCVSFCLFACLSLYPRGSSESHNRSSYVCACCQWPWLGRPLPALRYTMHFRLYGLHRVSHNGPYSGR